MLTQAKQKVFPLSLAALGIVFGDIGTSPLYAMRVSLHGLPITTLNVLGILSIIFWCLILMISTWYMRVLLRADNEGEGGVLALLALLTRQAKKYFLILFIIGIIGTGLVIGDGMITPAISVVSAMEGLAIISPTFSQFILPLTVFILLILFLCQHFGTARIGFIFGPVLLFWFFTLSILGASKIFQNPMVVYAINPYYGYEFFLHNGWQAYLLLGGVFLVITGAEALYADLGHFGKTPIRMAWFIVVLPSLLLNYFGQGAYLLQFPQAISNPFYAISPVWFYYPLIFIAAIATIIASQSVITACFSMTRQAILLNICPRLKIIQTSEDERGQIYVPPINFILGLGTIMLIIIFKHSDKLAGMYGVAVNLEMLVVSTLVICVASLFWNWPIVKIIKYFSIFMLIEIAFLGANLHKIEQGGWVPLVIALVCAFIMITWYKGFELLRLSFYANKIAIVDILKHLDQSKLHYVPDSTTIFITDPYDQSGGSFLHYLKLNHIMPANILILSIAIENYPYISEKKRYEFFKLSKNIYRLVLHHGFKQHINIPQALLFGDKMAIFPFAVNLEKATYLVETLNMVITKKKRRWFYFRQKKIFAFLLRNSAMDFDFFQLPYNRTISIGTYCEL